MKAEEIKKIVSKKMFLIDCFLSTAKLQSIGNPDSVLKLEVTNYFLGSVILELLIKILYELEHKELAPFTHNILKIFEQLDEKTKSFVRANYDTARKRQEKIFERINYEVLFPSFHNLLESNERFIKNFKYDAMGSKTNSAIDGQFYSELFNYINDELRKLDGT